MRYATNGALLQAENAGVTSDNFAYSVEVDTSGNCYVAGSFKGNTLVFGDNTLSCEGHADLFVVKYDPAGNPLWARSAGGILEDGALGVATDRYNNCYLGGYFKSTSISFGETTLTNGGTSTADRLVAGKFLKL